MGNACFGRRRSSKGVVVVHPLDDVPRRDDVGVRRLKVRMTRGQLTELMATAGKGVADYNSELGRLVFQECLRGSLHARLVVDTGKPSHQATCKTARERGFTLTPIQEHNDVDDDDRS